MPFSFLTTRPLAPSRDVLHSEMLRPILGAGDSRMLFHYRSNGAGRVVTVRAHREGLEWFARAFLLPLRLGVNEEVLLTGSIRTVLEFRCATQQEAIERMAFILETVYGCTRMQ